MIDTQHRSRIIIKEMILAVCTFVTASLFTSLWHEMGHALCLRAFHLKGIMYHNYVWYDASGVSIQQQVFITIVGTCSSLIELLVAFIILRFVKVENRILKMYIIWLLFWSTIQVLGYIMIGAFPFSNDFTILYNLFHIPIYVRILFAIGAVILLRRCLVKLNGDFAQIMNATLGEKNILARIYFINVPLCAMVIIVMVNLPTQSFASIIYPLLTPLYALFNYKSIRQSNTLNFKEHQIKRIQIIAAVFFIIVLISLFRFVTLGIKI